MGSALSNRLLTLGFLSFFMMLSSSLFAQRSIDELLKKYGENPKKGMEMFSASSKEKDEIVAAFDKFKSYNTTPLSADFYRNLLDYKAISCIGPDAEAFYDELIAFFDKKEGYTTSRSRMDGMKSKGYTLITKRNDGKTVKETNTIMYVLSEEKDSKGVPQTAIITIVTLEE